MPADKESERLKRRVRDRIYSAKRRLSEYEPAVPRWGHDWLTPSQVAARVGMKIRGFLQWVQFDVIPMPRRCFIRKHTVQLPYRFTDEYCEALRGCVITRNSAIGFQTRKAFRKLCWKILRPLARDVSYEMLEENWDRAMKDPWWKRGHGKRHLKKKAEGRT